MRLRGDGETEAKIESWIDGGQKEKTDRLRRRLFVTLFNNIHEIGQREWKMYR